MNGNATSGFTGSLFNIPPSTQPTHPTSSNLFGASGFTAQNNTQTETTTSQSSTPFTNIFAQNNPSSTPFSQAPMNKLFSSNDDAMHTSPDNSPARANEPTRPAEIAGLSGLSSPTQSQPSGGDLFSRVTQADSATQSSTTNNAEATVPTSPRKIKFGGIGQAPSEDQAARPNPFANIARTPSPEKEEPPTQKPSNPFANLTGASKPAGQPFSLFAPGANTATSQGPSLFSQPAKTLDQSSSITQTSSTSAPSSSSIFGQTPPISFAPPTSKAFTPAPTSAPPSNIFSKATPSTSTTQAAGSLFAPKNPAVPAAKSIFGSKPLSNPSTSTSSKNATSAAPGTSSAPAVQPVNTGSAVTGSTSTATGGSTHRLDFEPPQNFKQGQQYIRTIKLHALNIATKEYLCKIDPATDWTKVVTWHLKQTRRIMAGKNTQPIKVLQTNGTAPRASTDSNKRKADGEVSTESGEPSSPTKRSRGDNAVTSMKILDTQQTKETSQTSSVFKDILNNGAGRTTGLFGSLQPPTPPPRTNNIFSANTSTTIEAPSNSTPASSNIFGSLPGGQSATPSPSTTAKPAVGNNFFSGSKSQSSNIFGSPSNINLSTPSQTSGSSATAASPAFKPSTTLFSDAKSTTPASNLFSPKPTSATPTTNSIAKGGSAPALSGAATSINSTSFQIPKFGSSAGPVNFLNQFAKKAKSAEEEAKQKAKDEDFDSEEETEAEWEARYEEKQRKLRAAAEEAAKNSSLKFTIPVSTASSESDTTSKTPFTVSKAPSATTSNGLFVSRTGSPTPSTTGGASVFDTPASKSITSNNIFGHLSEAESSADAGKDGAQDSEQSDADEPEGSNEKQDVGASKSPIKSFSKRRQTDHDSDDETIEDVMRRKRQDRSPPTQKKAPDTGFPVASKSRSLFDRVTVGADGKPERDLPTATTEKSNGASEGMPKKATLFGNTLPPSTNIFQPKTTLSGDQTFKHDSPIKFGMSSAPSFNVTPASPSGGAGASDPKPTFGLFGSSNVSGITPATTAPSALAKTSTGGISTDVGFSFGTPPTTKPTSTFLSASTPGSTSTFPSGFNSPFTSRATTPFSADETSGKESAPEKEKSNDDDDTGPSDAQVLLTDLTEDEKRENDVLFECEKAKAMEHSKANGASWENKGIGPLRMLRNKSTGVVSILMRLIPSGRIIANSRLIAKFTPVVDKTTVRIVIPRDAKLVSWVMKFKTAEIASEFAKAYNDNKPT